jgi:glycosyltransferase involved in cell wall biosynthesis
VAVFIPRKNQGFLLDVLRRLPDRFKLVLAGPAVESGPNRERDARFLGDIRRRIEAEGLSDRVHLRIGFVENVEDYIRMSDVYVFPTLSEGLGTPMLESVACGVPVVVTRLPGVSDVWIKDGRNGYVSELDAEEFARKVTLAAGIERGELERSAAEMLRQAGSRAVDDRYYEILRKETGRWTPAAKTAV